MGDREGKVDVRLALRAYQAVLDRGDRCDGVYHLGELTAETDFDGYTVTIGDGRVTVRVLFHSRVDIDAPSGKALEDFVSRLERAVATSSG